MSTVFFAFSISYNANAFPKKSKSLFKDRVKEADLEEEIYMAGYYNAVIDFCNYSGAKEHKAYLKNLRGFVGYINWDLFKFFLKGKSKLEAEMYTAGIGWGGTYGGYGGQWQEGAVEFSFGIMGCNNKKSIEMILENNLNLPENTLFPFIKEKSNDNYIENIEILKNKLLSDKRDDYELFVGVITNKGSLIVEKKDEDTISKEIEEPTKETRTKYN